jgi:uncharacterized protein (TIGR02145 family)
MKLFLKITVIVLLTIGFIAIMQSCKKPTIPDVVTANVSGITQTSATSGGNVTDDGGAEVTSRGVCWSTSQNPTTSSTKTSDGTGTGTYSSSIAGLTPGATYYVKAYATNSEGTAYGNEVSFSSNPVILAAVTTAYVTSVTSTTAVSGGTISADGGGAITAKGVCWAKTTNPTISNDKTNEGGGNASFGSNVTGLSPTTTYYLRAYATNSAGTAYGDELNFTTTAGLATLITSPIYSITQATAKCGLEITYNGGSTIINSGLCWSTSQNPTIADSKTIDGYIWLFGLNEGTTYYVKAYATNSAGTAYGNQESFTTLSGGPIIFNPNLTYSTMTDIEGNVYKTILIGTQVWMAENLKTTKLNDNTTIPNVTGNAEWINLTSPGYCWYDNKETPYKAEYGALYNLFAANTGKLCPTGWHIPTDEEWYNLITFSGDENTAGIKLKETGTTHWESSNQDPAPTNETGFTALPGGSRSDNDGSFGWIGEYCNLWSTSLDIYPNYVAYLLWSSYTTNAYRKNTSGFSVRCSKNKQID